MREDAGDTPEWATTAFWVLVLVFNVAVFATAVGAMVLYFERDLALGGVLLGVGVVSWAVGLGGYVAVRSRLSAR